MSIRVARGRAFLNGVEISEEVFSISTEYKPGDLFTAKVELFIEKVETDADGTIAYHLGRGNVALVVKEKS